MLNIQLEYPPGFAGLSIAGTTEQQLRERAQSLVNAAAQHGDIDPAELTDQLMAVCERLNRFRILVFGAFPTQTAQPATATMTLSKSRAARWISHSRLSHRPTTTTTRTTAAALPTRTSRNARSSR